MKKYFLIIFCLLFLYPHGLRAAMTSTNYEIYADSFTAIDAPITSNTTFIIYSSTGDALAATSSGGVYDLRAGFQAEDKGILSLTLDSPTIAFGTLSTTTIASTSIVAAVSTDAATGYTLAASASDPLASGADTIPAVADGTVTAGVGEYGIFTTYLGTDTGLSGTPVTIAVANGTVVNSQTTITFRAAAAPSTAIGSYSQAVTFTLTVNP